MMLWLLSWKTAPAQDTLTIMSYNIYHAEQAYDEGKSSLQDIADLINREQPDFVALQEVDEMTERLAEIHNGKPFSLTDSLAELTRMKGYFVKTIAYRGGGYGIGLLSKRSLTPQKVELPNPQEGEVRAFLFAEAQTASGQPVIFGGTHLDHQFPENKTAQVQAISGYFSNRNIPIILGGDFNFTPDSEQYAQMQQQWTDAATLFSGEPEPTIPADDPGRRIDYFFLSDSGRWEVVDLRTIKKTYSDHVPVVATVVLHPE
ncbi:Metal-dependent hydrolase, endonuclease/exonuclease/phosphatase family [Fodinibius roseus]|uniref:Metal-dependent hydrolase, endonuclease/exonuclease/phosphatase family n=2 Tax=Fodinibius roseus TaxID=1194090 RepID=A0A1M4XUY7_9BACT|nr:Metal-dependent hydrolase, endonuclease/exonuclease/phosphatase family [Fodinibius roseus]